MYTLELNGSRAHKVVVGMTNRSGDGKLRGIGTDGKRVRKERKRAERKVGGGKSDFLVFCFVFNPPKNRAPFFQPHPIKKIPLQTVDK